MKGLKQHELNLNTLQQLTKLYHVLIFLADYNKSRLTSCAPDEGCRTRSATRTPSCRPGRRVRAGGRNPDTISPSRT